MSWYVRNEDTYEKVADDVEGVIEYLEITDELDDMLIEFAMDYYDFEDVMRAEIVYDGPYVDRTSVIDDFKENEIEEGKDFETYSGWLEWFERTSPSFEAED